MYECDNIRQLIWGSSLSIAAEVRNLPFCTTSGVMEELVVIGHTIPRDAPGRDALYF